ncbi:MAG: ROK family protein [Planctomycetes bacterium]|nr:ROK family protein [Planctomycetota bacterium]
MSLQNTRAPYYVGIDVGGTNIKAGVVDDDGRSLSHLSVTTEATRGPQIGLENIARAAEAAIAQSGLSHADLRGVGLATPGTMDIPKGLLVDPPNLPGWINFPIRDLLSERLKLPTVLQNDANAAAYGEFWAGGAKEASSLVFWTLGTGIGCGIIIDHVIIEGAHSHGAECGHIIVEMHHGRLCGTGQYGTLEAYAGARAIIARCEEALAAGRKSSVSQHIVQGEKLTPLMIAQAAEAGDELCDELVMETARYMGVGTTTLMHTIDPEMVLFGGAMTFGRDETPLGRRFIQEIRNEVKKRAFPIPAARTKIEYATLGGDAGYIGAAGCARLKFGDRVKP